MKTVNQKTLESCTAGFAALLTAVLWSCIQASCKALYI